MRFNHNIFWAGVVSFEVVLAKIPVPGVFTGINTATGERPARRDILEMKNDVPAFSLYIQALQAMQDRSETDQLSWFQVSGIHGRPYYAWDFNAQTPGAPKTGYCTHSDALFMSWHRPYLALYETILAGHVQTIAKKYNNQAYQNAADRFRIPYWDWAAPPYGMPDFFSTGTIRITSPSGPQDVPNPLVTYKFKRRPYPSTTFPSDSTLMNTYDRTVRRPDNNGNSDSAGVNSLLTSQAPSIAQQLYTVFSRATTYNNMVTQSSSGPSFEGPHGWLHITVGGNGHMTDVGYAGFDPIFLLHHTNVDRLGTIWQAIYPDSFMTPAKEGGGTFNLVQGQTISSTTPLIPFHQADGKTPWTTDSGRYVKTFGYSYPDVKDWAYSATAEGASSLKANVTARVNTLYNLRRSSNAKVSISARTTRVTTASKPPREWTVDISSPNAALGGICYSVQLFLGPAPEDAAQWVVQSVGAMYVLAQPMSTSGSTTTLLSRTEVVITDFLADRGVDTRDVEATKKFIDSNLEWGVLRADGSIVPNDLFKGLTLVVEDDIVNLPTDDSQFPKFSDKTTHGDVTPVNPVIPL